MSTTAPPWKTMVEGHMAILATRIHEQPAISQAGVCMVLGGGYGRGEGGWLTDANGNSSLYNDYDLVFIFNQRKNLVWQWCETTSQSLEDIFGIHVDITPIPQKRISRLPLNLTWYELGQGHQVVWGDETCLKPLVARSLDSVAPTEWGRLLVNRTSGVLFAHWLAQGHSLPIGDNESYHSFATRQIQKAWLAVGDVWLAQQNQYHHLVSVREQNMSLTTEKPPWIEHYQEAIRWKFSPITFSANQLSEKNSALIPELIAALTTNKADTLRPLASLRHSAKRLPASHLCSALQPPRERLRKAAIAAFKHDELTFKCYFPDKLHYFNWWQHCG
jgi:hypothetical protein